MKSSKLFIAACILLAMPVLSFSQKYWEVSVGGGLMNYYGDLTPPLFTLKEVHPGGQLSVRRYFDRQHAVRVNILHGTLTGNDRNFDRNYLRGNSFVGRLTEVSVLGEFDIKGRKRFSAKLGYQKTSSPYFFGGASMAYSNPVARYGQADSGDADKDYIDWHVGMPVGGGFRFDLKQNIVLSIELGYRFTISDYLDGTQATGNAYKNDSYTFGGIQIGYRFYDKEKEEEKPMEKAKERAMENGGGEQKK
jgi:OmpA-OmpF porin, OOP family